MYSRSEVTGSRAIRLSAGILGACLVSAHADDPQPREFFPDQPQGLGEQTVAWRFSYQGEILSNLSGGLHTGTTYEGVAELGLGINLERLAGWKDTIFYADMLYPHGEGLTQRFTGDLNDVSDIDANDSLRLFKCWVQKNFGGDRLTVRAGLLAVDEEFFLSDGASHFFNGGFGAFAVVSENIVTSLYPVSALGVRVTWKPNDAVTLRAAVFSGDVGTQAENLHNTRWKLSRHDGAAAFVEAEYATPAQSKALPGTYQIGGFYDSKFFPDLSSGHDRHGEYGLYASADQMVWRRPSTGDGPAQGLDLFARAAWSPDDRSIIGHEFQAGATFTGPLPKRENDILGLGFIQSTVSSDARGTDGRRHPSHRESVLEFFYRAAISEHFSVQPDLQYIFNPGATAGTRDAFAVGLRFSVVY